MGSRREEEQMTPNPFLLRVAIVAVIVGFVVFFTWTLVDTWNASGLYEPNSLQLFITPTLAGALAVGTALQLGVEVKAAVPPKSWTERLLAFLSIKRLITLGAVVYLIAAGAGIFVWAKRMDETPELVSALVLTAVGYLAAAYAAAARS
jgi:hypothetical protein